MNETQENGWRIDLISREEQGAQNAQETKGDNNESVKY